MWLYKLAGVLILASATVNGIVYLGCYKDSWDELPMVQMRDSASNTPEECALRCSSYRYAGVKSTECYCGDTMNDPYKRPESECDTQCPGDYNKMCGGLLRINVYTNWELVKPVISPITTQSTSTTKIQTSGTAKTTRKIAPTTTQTLSLETATSPNYIQSTDSSSTTANQSDASNQEVSQRGSTTTVIAAGVSVAVTLAVAAVVIVLVLWKKQVLPCSKTTATSNIDKHTYENGPEQSYEDLAARNESNTNYCVLDINIESAARYYNIERGQNHEGEANDNCNPEYYIGKVASENVEKDYMN